MRLVSACVVVLLLLESFAGAAPRRLHRRRRFVRVVYVDRPIAVAPVNVVDGIDHAPQPERLKAAPVRTSESEGPAPAPARVEPRAAPPPARLEVTTPPATASKAPAAWAPRPSERDTPGPRGRYDVLGGGVALFLAGWGADIGATYGFHAGNPTRALIPVAGPILQLGDRYGYSGPGLSSGSASSDTSSDKQLVHYNRQVQVGVYVALGVDIAAQVAGLALVVIGPTLRRHAPPARPGTLHAQLAPTANGLAVTF